METERGLIIVPKFKGNLFQKNNKINKLKKILFFFIFIIIFVLIGTNIIFINITYKNSINLSNEKLLKVKNDLQLQISNLEEIIKLKEKKGKLNKISNNELINITSFNYEKNEKFNQNINDIYIKEQNNFCDNQNTFYNKEFEDKIKKVDIKFEDKNYNMYVYKTMDIVSQSIIIYKNYESFETKQLMNALNYFSKKKKINNQDIYIIDIGANIGWYSFIFGKYGFRVISFEPLELNTIFFKLK